MGQVVVGVSDCGLSDQCGQVLTTYALGSCIGLAAYDPEAAVGGLLHFMLPDSNIDPALGRDNPFRFADTGIPLFLQRIYALGASKHRLIVAAAGAAEMMDRERVFDIGRRNYQAMRRALWKAGLLLHAEEIGGASSRTVRLEIGSGRVWLQEGGGGQRDLIPAVHGGKPWHIVS